MAAAMLGARRRRGGACLAAARALAGAASASGLAIWLIGGALSEIAFRVKLFDGSLADAARRLGNLPRSAFGTALAHAGLGIVVIGIVATTAWRSESILAMKPEETADIAGYQLTFKGVAPREGPNYRERVGLFEVTRGGAGGDRA